MLKVVEDEQVRHSRNNKPLPYCVWRSRASGFGSLTLIPSSRAKIMFKESKERACTVIMADSAVAPSLKSELLAGLTGPEFYEHLLCLLFGDPFFEPAVVP